MNKNRIREWTESFKLTGLPSLVTSKKKEEVQV